MSRTYESLQGLEKEQQSSAAAPLPASKASPGTVRSASTSLRVGDEEVCKLVQRVFRSDAPGAPRVVVFSGVEHGDGCTWICSSAAMTLAAQSAARVCLVDANLRTPSLHNVFGIPNRTGLAQAISEAGPIRSYAQQISGSNLWVIPSGVNATQQAPGLNMDSVRQRLEELRAEFDVVMLDTAPANLYADAVAFGRFSDGVILVLQSNTTRRESALKAKQSCEISNVRLLGAVLNKRTYPIPQHLYDRL
ncbi:MAG: CpsD/CapB family tyrosine-protein kinase [Acidobacteriales bacterium]|nr:CpsD/CapB family tyrosine-protein kinase [Terriglobales bacterium]